MSDLSQPLTLKPPVQCDGPKTGTERPGLRSPQSGAFAWPMPPYAAYPSAEAFDGPQACVIEGLNGKSFAANLLAFDADAGVAQVQVPPSRGAMPLRFSQFRRLTLTRVIEPVVADEASRADAVLNFRAEVDFGIALNGGGELTGRTVGHVERSCGLFLFPPEGDDGRVTRVFVPATAVASSQFGPRIGDVLVEQNTATPAQIQQALDEQRRRRDQRLGDVLVAQRVLTPKQLEVALQQQARMPMVRVGEALLGLGFIDQAQLDSALAQQREERGTPLGELLVRQGHITPADLRLALARKMGYPVVDIEQFPLDRDLLQRVPHAAARRLKALPLILQSGRLVVAVDDPSRGDTLDEIEFLTQHKAVPVLCGDEHWLSCIDRVYQRMGLDAGHATLTEALPVVRMDGGDAQELLAQLELQNDAGPDAPSEDAIEQSDSSLVRLINAMITDAHAQGASDIHIECQPGREKVRIRFRRDGVLKPYMELPHTHRSALLARLKIMSDLDISERRRPQDGKINFARFMPGHALELRVATIPTQNGLEDAVLRLLASAKPIALDKLGLSAANFQALTRAIERPYGLVLCVGPTGSGKTTTLHSALSRINTPERKIWTAEDPVEITQAGLRQVQVNAKIDWTFAKALRSFLRADPDVVMVGEIRDTETSRIAVEASLTGHLVLSTLHTNSAPETVTRLLDMGLDPFNFADALLAVLAQRLVRRLCSQCVTAQPASEGQVDELLQDHLRAFTDGAAPAADEVLSEWRTRFGRNGVLMHHHSPGCKHCEGSGLRGRAGIHELLSMDRNLRRLIQTGARVEELQRAAMQNGMRTLRQDGIEKVLAGVTTIDEVRATSNA